MSTWQQTVMSDEQIEELTRQMVADVENPEWDDIEKDWQILLQAQAEISFRAGINEVVEWLNAYVPTLASDKDWQAFLKELGIDNRQ